MKCVVLSKEGVEVDDGIAKWSTGVSSRLGVCRQQGLLAT
jgi:hypothetical protein